MNTINASTYVLLLKNLRDVCFESKHPFQNENDIETLGKTISSLPSFTLDQVVKQINNYAKGKLLVYEAANRTGLKELSEYYLKKWAVKFDSKIQAIFPEEPNANIYPSSQIFFRLHNPHSFLMQKTLSQVETQELNKKLNKVLEKTKWPSFGDSVNAENDLTRNLKFLVSKDVILSKFHETVQQFPEFLQRIMANISLDTSEHFLIHKYCHLIKTINFHLSLKDNLTDDMLRVYLARYPHAEKIDLSNCIRLSSHCLQNCSHKSVNEIILTGTQIKEENINRSNFPLLKIITQDNCIDVYDLKDFKEISSWSFFRKKIEEANLIFHSNSDIDNIFRKFTDKPTSEGLEALTFFENSQIKLHSSYDRFSEKMIESLLLVWRKMEMKDFVNENAFGKVVFSTILERWLDMSQNNKKGNPIHLITKMIKDELLLLHSQEEDKSGNTIKDEPIIDINDIYRKRFLLKNLRNIDWDGFKNVASKINSNIAFMDNIIFNKEISYDFEKIEGRNRNIRVIELLNEFYVELNSRNYGKEAGVFGKLLDPSKAIIVKRRDLFHDSMFMFNLIPGAIQTTTYKPGPLYPEFTDQSLACAFLLKLSKEKRERLLENISNNFSDYLSKSGFYALPKIVLGVVEEADIPVWDKESLIKDALLQYEGIFSEDISNELKDKFWKDLTEGKLGGLTNSLIDALRAFYNKKGTSEEWKIKITNALKMIGGVHVGPLSGHIYHNPFNDTPVKAYARKTLVQLGL